MLQWGLVIPAMSRVSSDFTLLWVPAHGRDDSRVCRKRGARVKTVLGKSQDPLHRHRRHQQVRVILTAGVDDVRPCIHRVFMFEAVEHADNVVTLHDQL